LGERFTGLVILVIVPILPIVVVIGGSSPHSTQLGRSERSEGVLIERRHTQGELVEVVDAELLVLPTVDAEEHILALLSVPAHAEHILKHPQDATGGGKRWRRRARAGGAAEVEGTSEVMVSSIGACGLISVMKTSFTNSILITFMIIIII
jgi:hypothetical protein